MSDKSLKKRKKQLMDRIFCNKISEISGLKRIILNKLIIKWYLITYKKSKKIKDNFQKNFKS